MTDTVQQLHELPDLAAEVYLTWGHPNPSDRPVTTVRRIHPRVPADLDTLDALRPDELGLLHRLAQCVRAVVENMPEHPGDLTDTPTWAGECDWLITHANTWRADAFLTDLVGSEVHAIHRELCRVARVHPPLKLQCPRCQAPVHLAPGGQYSRPPFGGPAQYAWRCTCGDSQAFSGPLSISSTWTSAQMHAYLWGGSIA